MWFSRYKMPPRAELYANTDFLYFQTVSGIDISITDPKGQKILLSPDTDVTVIGDSLKACLKDSRRPRRGRDPNLYDYIAVTERYKLWRSDMMQRYNYKTQKAMFSSLHLISFQEIDNFIRGEKLRLDNLHKQSWTRLESDPVLNMHSQLSSDLIGAEILEFLAANVRP